MADEPPVAVVRRAFERFAAVLQGDDIGAALLDTLHPEVDWRGLQHTHDYHGVEGAQRAIGTWLRAWRFVNVEVEDLEQVGDAIVARVHNRVRGASSDVPLEERTYQVIRLRDGLIVHFREYLTEEEARAAAGSAAP